MMGQLNSEEIENLLHTAVLGRIGCSDGKLIYVVPISFAYDGTYVYCHTHEGIKISMLRKNPSLCFEVELLKDLAKPKKDWDVIVGPVSVVLVIKDRTENLKNWINPLCFRKSFSFSLCFFFLVH